MWGCCRVVSFGVGEPSIWSVSIMLFMSLYYALRTRPSSHFRPARFVLWFNNRE